MCIKYYSSLCKSKVMSIVLGQETKLFYGCIKFGISNPANEIIQHSRARREMSKWCVSLMRCTLCINTFMFVHNGANFPILACQFIALLGEIYGFKFSVWHVLNFVQTL
jgi:hypothetical protein